MKNSIVKELKDKKPATIIWLIIMIIGLSISFYGVINFNLWGLIGSGIIFSSILCVKFEKQINESVSNN